LEEERPGALRETLLGVIVSDSGHLFSDRCLHFGLEGGNAAGEKDALLKQVGHATGKAGEIGWRILNRPMPQDGQAHPAEDSASGFAEQVIATSGMI
jgi:hypothetical protein